MGRNIGKIRVCNVDEEGRFGGPERRIVQVARAVKTYGVDTHVVYPIYDSEIFSKEISGAGINKTPLAITRLSKEKKILARYLAFFLVEVFCLFRFFRKHKFDLIHVNGSYQFKVAIAGKLSGIPVVWHLNDTKMQAIVKNICIKIAKYCASGFIVAGQRVYDFYIRGTKLEQKPYTEIHAPVDVNVFDPESVSADSKVIQSHGTKIVTVSGINPTKGLEYFIEMASKLQAEHRDLCYFVAGAEFSSQKQYYQYLKDLIFQSKLTNKKLSFLGMVNDVPALLQAADICVFTSISEASPTSIWEAMSMGKAIVTTDVGSVNQYIVDGISGFVVPVKDVDALFEKVDILIKNPLLRKKFGQKARLVAEKNLDISIAAAKHASFYKRIVENTKDGKIK